MHTVSNEVCWVFLFSRNRFLPDPEAAHGRMVDDDIKDAVLLKRSPKELRDHLVLESPQLANVENKFPAMRELHWCRSRRVFFPQKPPMEIAAVSTTVGDSDATESALGWYGSWQEKKHGKGKNTERGSGFFLFHRGKLRDATSRTSQKEEHKTAPSSALEWASAGDR